MAKKPKRKGTKHKTHRMNPASLANLPLGSAKPGEMRGEKFKTPEERAAVFAKFIHHISEGYSVESFCDGCHHTTIAKMIQLHGEEFDDEILALSKAKGQLFWEKLGMAGAAGKVKGFNQGSWIFNMKNRFGWRDKVDHNVSGDLIVNVKRFSADQDQQQESGNGNRG